MNLCPHFLVQQLCQFYRSTRPDQKKTRETNQVKTPSSNTTATTLDGVAGSGGGGTEFLCELHFFA